LELIGTSEVEVRISLPPKKKNKIFLDSERRFKGLQLCHEFFQPEKIFCERVAVTRRNDCILTNVTEDAKGAECCKNPDYNLPKPGRCKERGIEKEKHFR
jgi:hypothetical protein